MYQKCEKIVSYGLFFLLCASLLILMYLGRYNHPTGDDYYYAGTTKQVWNETGSIFAVIGEAAKGVAREYVHWQGTYSAMFLMYLPPNVFGESGYRLVTAMMLLLYAGGVFYLLKPILCGVLRGSLHLWCLVSSAFVLLTIQTVPFQGESFFWYNGSMYYTGFFAVTLFFFGSLCRYILAGRKRYLPVMALLSLFLAGGNYVSLLPCILLTLTASVFLLKKRSKKGIAIGIMAVLLLAGLAVSAMAPGNQVRQDGLWDMSATKAILKSLLQGLSYLWAWLRGWWFMTAILLTPFFWKTYGKIPFSFKYPVLVLGYLYGIFCSMSCPTFYAMNSTGPARALAIVYYGFMLFTLMGYYYLLGWFYRWQSRRAEAKTGKERPTHKREAANGKRAFGILAVSISILFIFRIATGEFARCSSVKAVRILLSGEAYAYEQEYQERLKVLKDPSVQDVVFLPYEHQPEMLFVGDFTGDAENENNVRIARYFNKNSIRVQY